MYRQNTHTLLATLYKLYTLNTHTHTHTHTLYIDCTEYSNTYYIDQTDKLYTQAVHKNCLTAIYFPLYFIICYPSQNRNFCHVGNKHIRRKRTIVVQFGEDRCRQFRIIVVAEPPTHPQTPPAHRLQTDRTDYNTLRRS